MSSPTDHLLHSDRAASVVLYLKLYPYYVSDATTDTLACLRHLTTAPGYAAEIGKRLRQGRVGRPSLRGIGHAATFVGPTWVKAHQNTVWPAIIPRSIGERVGP